MMRILAPAKINLYLRVGKPRADGFHPVVTWMATVGLFDVLEFERANGSSIELTCNVPEIPCDESNLVVKAAIALADALGEEKGESFEFGLKVRLQKRIPSGAGLGGGSSDAAATLMALSELWMAGWDRQRMTRLAMELGSDVPFFLHSPSAICRRRGEEVEKAMPPRPRAALLILPGLAMPTGPAYRKFDEMSLGKESSTAREFEPDWRQWVAQPARELLPLLANDLEAAAFAIAPELGELRAEVEKLLGRPVRMSGSGSSLFTLFDSEAEARWAAGQVMQNVTVRAVAVRLACVADEELEQPDGSQ